MPGAAITELSSVVRILEHLKLPATSLLTIPQESDSFRVRISGKMDSD